LKIKSISNEKNSIFNSQFLADFSSQRRNGLVPKVQSRLRYTGRAKPEILELQDAI
jgi:hypothetical protein